MEPTLRQILDTYQEEVIKLLQSKTGWGRNEIKAVLQEAKGNTVMAIAEKKLNAGG